MDIVSLYHFSCWWLRFGEYLFLIDLNIFICIICWYFCCFSCHWKLHNQLFRAVQRFDSGKGHNKVHVIKKNSVINCWVKTLLYSQYSTQWSSPGCTEVQVMFMICT